MYGYSLLPIEEAEFNLKRKRVGLYLSQHDNFFFNLGLARLTSSFSQQEAEKTEVIWYGALVSI
jgi:hypothetical protein